MHKKVIFLFFPVLVLIIFSTFKIQSALSNYIQMMFAKPICELTCMQENQDVTNIIWNYLCKLCSAIAMQGSRHVVSI